MESRRFSLESEIVHGDTQRPYKIQILRDQIGLGICFLISSVPWTGPGPTIRSVPHVSVIRRSSGVPCEVTKGGKD